MPRKITAASTLDNLRKEAKRWLKSLRDGDAAAIERFKTATSSGPTSPTLRDVQLALAREYGFEGWATLKQAVESNARTNVDGSPAGAAANRFLECACPDHHVRSLPAHRVARHAAMRILAQNPEIPRHDLFTAVVCGEIEEVRRVLSGQPQLANSKRAAAGPDRSGSGGNYDFLGDLGGKDWTPLLFLSFTRLPLEHSVENSIEIARLLLDHGADPNAFYMAGGSRYTPLTGAIGEGEENRPPHPRRDELARLLLERGAEPYDGQVIYNIHFRGDVLWWLKLMYEFSIKSGRRADWDNPDWLMLSQGGYGSGARWHLRIAIEHGDCELARWCLEHGANPNAAPETDRRFPRESLYQRAVREGQVEIAGLLLQHGASKSEVALGDEERYVAAALRMDRAEIERILGEHPEFLHSTAALFTAARQDRADVVAFLLDRGTPIETEDKGKQRALHVAASRDSVKVAALLIERGAEIDPYEMNYGNTPLDFAAYHDYTRMIDLLRPHSRDVWNLVFIGDVERLTKVILEKPERSRVTWQTTPLFWLPDDESKAIEIARLFLEHGADPDFRSSKDGTTAAELARRRGMHRVAAMLEAASSGEPTAKKPDLVSVFDQAAHDVVTVCARDDESALDRLSRQFDRLLSFEMVRTGVRGQVSRLASGTGEFRLELEEARDLVARNAGHRDWAAFLQSASGTATPQARLPEGSPAEAYQRLAQDFVDAYEGDGAALERFNTHYQRSFTLDDLKAEIWRRVYAFRQRSSRVPKNFLRVEEAQTVIAQDAGFGSWGALLEAAASGTPAPGAPFVIDSKENRAEPGRRMSDADWDDLIAVMKERRISTLSANGLMTDRVIARITELDHMTSLHLGGSRELSDDGLLQLARMPQLERLNLSEYPGGRLTDRGLEVLRHLPNLRQFEMTWQKGISDAGVANLRFCERLERVDIMGSPTGDGAIEALQDKENLRSFSTGRLVTDAGLRLLQNFPQMKRWHGEEPKPGDPKAPSGGAKLLIDGPFTDAGLAGLAGLEGVLELDLFWHVTGITPEGFVHLKHLPNLAILGCDGELSGDVAMVHIAAIPRLRRLRAQESAATDEGFVALSKSQTLEGFWGRECSHFGSRGFVAFSKMPALRTLGVSCKNVSDEALATLPDFPALCELTPIGFTDAGFRHVGRCQRLERLTCMYCRDTTDAATEHLAGLHIKYYYAGLTQITDRSLEILGRIQSLEQVELYECKGITDAGLPFLAALPNLREVHLDGLPGVTMQGTAVFPEGIRVLYSS